jgi:hypothetical protein
MARRGGNDSPFNAHTGIDWSGNSDSSGEFGFTRSGDGAKGDKWGPSDAASVDHLNKRANRNDKQQLEYGYTSEKTVLDKPLNASTSRVKKTSATAYEPDVWYRGPKEG